MLIVLLLISIVGLILGMKFDEDIVFIFLIGFSVKFFVLAILVGFIVNGRVLDNKITMYEEENSKIESQIQTVVKEYLRHEQETFESCSAESMITLVDMYPELKSDTLVSKQIDVYMENNKQIKELKQEKIDISNYRWWVYFGK